MSPALLALAAFHGVATEYWDWQGRHIEVSDATIVTVLAALGVDATTEDASRAALAEVEDHRWRQVLPPTVMTRTGWTPWVPVHVPHGQSVAVDIRLEDGTTRAAPPVEHWVSPRWVDGRLVGEATVELPGDLPAGWHRLTALVGDGTTADAALVVTPDRLEPPPVLREGRAWGIMTQLYQARSAASWGTGDLADLAGLAGWAAGEGADFVLVNPLHAAEPTAPIEPSPYLPTARGFANPGYLRVEDVPEAALLTGRARARLDACAARASALNQADSVDRDAAWQAKREALEIIFAHGRSAGREAGLAAYRAERGPAIETFATWCVLADEHGADWTLWPAPLQDAGSPPVAAYRGSHPEQVTFHAWLQWLFDDQMASAQATATSAGMRLGVLNDLAVGVHPRGADAWGLSSVLAHGVTVGAPPDQFNQLGQNWSQPPWHPQRLAEMGYAPFRDMVRAVLRDSGGIRVDHVIGLFRLWWVPKGHTPAEGTYVRYDDEALIGILVLEASRVGAVVVGEDLGVVEPRVRDVLRERGVLGTSILWFEWTDDGRPLPADAYRELCLASVTTHDLPPTAGYLDLAHVRLRERLHLLTRGFEEESAHELASIDRVREALVTRGLLAPEGSAEDMVVALHAWLVASPARMLGVSLSDLVGDRRIINQPGTQDEYPNWRIPLSDHDERPVLWDDAVATPLAERITAVMPPRT